MRRESFSSYMLQQMVNAQKTCNGSADMLDVLKKLSANFLIFNTNSLGLKRNDKDADGNEDSHDIS